MYGAVLLTVAFVLQQVLGAAEAVTPMTFDSHHLAHQLRSSSPWRKRGVTADILEEARPRLLLGLGAGEHLEAAGQVQTDRGTALLKLEETFQGVPVSGQAVVLEVGEGAKGRLRGRLIRGIIHDVPTVNPALGKEEAISMALRVTGDNRKDVMFDPEKNAQLQIYVSGRGGGMKARLVYRLSYRVETSRRIARPTFIIDANDGSVMKQWDSISFARQRMFDGNSIRRSFEEPEKMERSSGRYGKLKRLLERSEKLERSSERYDKSKTLLERSEKLGMSRERSEQLERLLERTEKLRIQSRRVSEKLVVGVGGNTKTGKYWYGRGVRPALEVLQYPNGTCGLINDLVEVYNCRGSYDCDHTLMHPHAFNCEQGNQDAVNGAFSPMNDAFFHIGETYRMFQQWYSVDPSTLLPQTTYGDDYSSDGGDNNDDNRCKARVHYGEEFENAFWDGETLTIGDGGQDRFPLTSLNMVAHEMAHGATEARAGLVGTGQSGAINEAFSDMAAEAAEWFSRNSTDWTMGYEDAKAPNASLRYFSDPTLDGFSIGHYRDYCLGADAHSASGIFNRVFYLLATTPGWSIRTAFRVFFAANSLYWHPDSQFHDAACDVVASARELGYDADDVTRAFKEVGIEPCSQEESKSLPGPVVMSNGASMTFEIQNHGIAANELLFAIDAIGLVKMIVDTGGMEFQVESPHGILPPYFNLPTMGGCLGNKRCVVKLTALEDAQLTILAMSRLKGVVSEERLGPEGSVLVSFTLPAPVVKSQLRLAFIATAGSGGGIVYYTRHGRAPEVTSLRFDVMGRNDETALMCKPKSGTYYVKVVPLAYSDGPVRNVKIDLYAVFDGKLAEETTPEER